MQENLHITYFVIICWTLGGSFPETVSFCHKVCVIVVKTVFLETALFLQSCFFNFLLEGFFFSFVLIFIRNIELSIELHVQFTKKWLERAPSLVLFAWFVPKEKLLKGHDCNIELQRNRETWWWRRIEKDQICQFQWARI